MQVNHLILQFSGTLNFLFCNFLRSKLHKIVQSYIINPAQL